MKKFVELLNKYKREVVSGAVIITLPICIGMIGTSCANKEMNEVNKREESQIAEEKIPEQPEIIPPVEENKSNLEVARSLIEPSLEDTMAGLNYELVEEENSLILIMDLPAEELPYISESLWEDLKANAIYAQTSWQEVFDMHNLGVTFFVFIGDIEKDEAYLAIGNDGKIILDVLGGPTQVKLKEF